MSALALDARPLNADVRRHEYVATVTLDTNVLPADEVLAAGRMRGDHFVVVSVTEREIRNHPFHICLSSLDAPLPELGVWDESEWGNSVWVSEYDAQRLAAILEIICAAGFPSNWSSLSPGQRRQLRDAMIFEAHARAGRDIFITDDQRGFILHGRRAALETLCSTSILTSAQYLQSR